MSRYSAMNRIGPNALLAAAALATVLLGVALLAAAPAGASTPRQQAELTAAEAAEGDFFGRSVAVAADTALVGAPNSAAGGLDGAGAVYVFTRESEAWTQLARLTASDASEWSAFGAAVAISGDTALVGAPGCADGADEEAGAAYVFTRSGSVWTQEAVLLAADPAALDSFGASVAISGDTAVIGAPYHTVSGQVEAGAAYVFTRSGDVWTQQTTLTASGPGAGDWLGTSVAVDGETALAGADGRGAGAAYVFTRSGTAWSQQSVLEATGAVNGDSFGASVALHDDVALAGTPGHDAASAEGAGAAYVFTRSDGAWAQEAELLEATPAEGDSFGSAVALDTGAALIGAPGRDAFGIADAGAAISFASAGGVWNLDGEITATQAAADDQLGGSVALAGRTVLAGADGHATGGLDSAGAAYVFTLDGLPVPPTIFSFSPAAAAQGKVVTLLGEAFTDATAVAFGGISTTTFSVLSDARITVTVPAGAKTGSITVTTPLGSGASAGSFVVKLPARVYRLRPSCIRRGRVITITGRRFGATRSGATVAFGSKKVRKYVSWSDTRIRCRVPGNAKLGKVAVRVKTAGGTSNVKYLRVRR